MIWMFCMNLVLHTNDLTDKCFSNINKQWRGFDIYFFLRKNSKRLWQTIKKFTSFFSFIFHQDSCTTLTFHSRYIHVRKSHWLKYYMSELITMNFIHHRLIGKNHASHYLSTLLRPKSTFTIVHNFDITHWTFDFESVTNRTRSNVI